MSPIHQIGGPIEKPEALSPGLLRQRRNLIAISLFLIVFDFADIQLGKVRLLGTELIVGKPRILGGLAWVIWAYFLVRYFQYLLGEPDLGLKWRLVRDRIQLCAQGWFGSIRKSAETGDLVCVRDGLRWKVGYQRYDTSTSSTYVEYFASTSALHFFWWGIRALLYVAIFTTYVTDFVLPVVLALAAPVVTAITRG